MILHLLRMRRNVNRNVFNARKNVSATTELALIIAIFQVAASLLLVATVLRCHGDDVANKKVSKCRQFCDLLYGYPCLRECDFVADDISRCGQKCHLDLVKCLADCVPWWEDWW